MASGKIANLSVGVSLDTAEFSAGLTKAELEARKFGEQIGDSIKAAGALLAGYFSASAFAGLIKSSIDAADHLNDLSKQTGIAVDTLGGIGFAAGQAGGSLETAAVAAGKLNKTLAEAAAGNDKASEAFKLLGLSVKDAEGRTKSADRVMAEVADKFAGYADGPEKAALAIRIFGEEGAKIIPLLDDGGAALLENIEYYKRYSGVTQDAADAADKFNDTQGKLHLISQAFGTTLATQLLPTLQGLAEGLLEMKEKSTAATTAAEGINSVFKLLVELGANVTFVFVGIGREIAALSAQAAALSHLNLDGFHAISEAVKEDGVKAREQLDSFVKRLNEVKSEAAGTTGVPAGEPESPKKAAPRLAADNGRAPKDDPTKKLLENRLKAIEAGIKQEQDLLTVRNRFLDLYDGQSLMSVDRYYEAKRNAQQANLASTIAGYDAEISALRAYQSKADKATDRAAAEGKIQTAIEKRADAVRRAGEEDLALTAQQMKAAKDYENSVASVTAQVLELQQQLGKAAAIKFDLANDALTKRFSAEGNADALKALETLRAYTIAQADYTKLSTDSSQVLDQLKIQEDRVSIARQLGMSTELDGLSALGSARQAAAKQLQAIVEAQEAVARASGNPALILNAQKARVALEQLQASAEPLQDKFSAIFKDGLGDAFADFLTGAKTASQAFKSFANTVISQLARIAAQNLAQSVIGSSTSGGGLMGLFGSLLGGSSSGESWRLTPGTDGTALLPELATGTNYVPYDGFKASLHKGEAVVPARFNPAAGGGVSSQPSVVNNIVNNVAAGISRGEVLQMLQLAQKSMEARVDQKLARM